MTEADARARREVRRYCVRNGLDRLGTLTYAPEHLPEEWHEVWADIERFRRRLARVLGERIAIVAVIEPGEKLGRLHVHIVFGQFIDKRVLAEAWGKGFVDVRKLRVAGVGRRERCRLAARYVSKYVTKGMEGEDRVEGRRFNGRRYSVTKGFRATRRSTAVASFLEGFRVAHERCGGSVVWSWSSAGDEDWRGPPMLCLHFGDP